MRPWWGWGLEVRDVIKASAALVTTSPKKTLAPEWNRSVAVAAPMPVAALDYDVSLRWVVEMGSKPWGYLPGHHHILAA
jgi:hypothetical protein